MKKKIRIPGITFSFSRLIGFDRLKRKIATMIGIPTTRLGLERKIGGSILNLFFRKRK